jgi:ribosomal protein L11 methyltransferase
MYLWRKLAEPHWLSARESILQARSRGQLAIISKPGRKRLQLEITFRSRNDSRRLVEEFGGRAEKLPRHWLQRFTRVSKTKPLKLGKRLLISRKDNSQITSAVGKPPLLVIPASTAFGTGEHATTAMSLRLLEQLTRGWKNGWSLADLGTGSGILALAAKRFGARRVLAIDVDPVAISTAKINARRNGIGGVDFQLADLRHWKPPRNLDIVTANLFSGLLMRLLPKLRRSGWLILSGLLRTQENEFLRALRRNNIEIVKVKRRGKWITVLAKGSACIPPAAAGGRLTPLWICVGKGRQLGSF